MTSERGRKQAVKQAQVANVLRRDIVLGELPPGSRLPVRRELERQFQVSTITVQRALDTLVEDGFIQANGSQGTYVAEEPPHLSRVGVVFPYRPTASGRWPEFWTTLMRETGRMEKAISRRLPFFYDASDMHGDAADFRDLCRAVERDLVGGLVFVAGHANFAGTVVLDQPGMPRVLIGNESDCMPSVSLDRPSFFDRGIAHLAERGARRLAILSVPNLLEQSQQLIDLAASRGLECRPQWIQTGDPHRPEYVRPLAHLLMDRPAEDRPDALLIGDDNLVDHALGGVLAAGVRIPQELSVVAHCNFPCEAASVVPITRLGYDAHEIMASALSCIDRMRKGLEIESPVRIRAVFETELAGRVLM